MSLVAESAIGPEAVGVCFVRPTAFVVVVAICFAVEITMVMKYYCPNTLHLG